MNMIITFRTIMILIFRLFNVIILLHMFTLANAEINDVTITKFKITLKPGVLVGFIIDPRFTIKNIFIFAERAHCLTRLWVVISFNLLLDDCLDCIMSSSLKVVYRLTRLIMQFQISCSLLTTNSAGEFGNVWRFLFPYFL
jgi:hypothetical protein